mmetsp:Transcript_22543/g.34756  ORF Transcript_22543/g.34756 Transcript_22543/m.34756 type:complete len:177 (+) Transcript_22543:69-599(+)
MFVACVTMTTTMRSIIAVLLVCGMLCGLPTSIFALSSSSSSSFSLSAYQKARAKETSNQLDASRFHFQILFVDNDNFHGRIAEGMLAQIAEYNDALFTLFPYSSTVESSSSFETTTTRGTTPMDPTAPLEALVVCEALGLCSITCAEEGTAFDVSYCLDQYDLIIAINEDIQSRLK